MIYRRHVKSCSHRRQGRRYWQCQCPVWIDFRKNGGRINKSMDTTDYEEAKSLAESWLDDTTETFDSGTSRKEKVKATPITIAEAWAKFLGQAKARKLSPTSIYKYDLLRRRMEEFAEKNEYFLLRELNTDVLEDFQSEWNEGDEPLSDVTLSKTLERLKSFCRAAFLRKWIDENPALTLRGPKPKPRPTLPFTDDEMTRILGAIEKYRDKTRKTGQGNALRLRAFVLTLRYTGMRLGDVATLSTDRLIGNKIQLYTQKTGVPVYCVLPQFVADLLHGLPRISERHFFWTGNSTVHTVNGIWQRTLQSLFRLAAIKNGYAHRLRDSFSVSLLLAGVPIEQVSILLGHSNIKVTQEHYNPWVRDRQLQLEADLQRAWNRDPVVLLNSKGEIGVSTKNLPN
jgi:integrase/recombinase XerD